ncbi:MAG: choice-of-anchor J domain-containing protein [Thermoplasmatales archaeon]|nr:choice-of-anchor J domain-containing protein [Thermoplasmatales archaeon]
MKEKNAIGSLVLRRGIVTAVAILLLGTGLMMLLETKAKTDPFTITGYVYDENGYTLEGATVRIRDEHTGAWGENITDVDGRYSITLGGGTSAPPWMEWYDGDPLLAIATYDGREGRSFTYIDESEIDNQGYMWLNITLGTPKTTKTVGEPEFKKYDFDNGSANHGYLVSPIINVTQDVAWLSFWTWWQIEGVEPSSCDLMNVYISTDGGYNWNLLKTLNPDSNPTEPEDRDYLYYGSGGFNTPPAWVYESIDISAYVPDEIVIIFEFNTVNESYNYWEGWYIDDIRITEFGGNVPFSDDVENGVQNWTYNGLWHITNHRRKSASHSWYYGIEKSYVTNETSFTLEAEGDYDRILYRINGGDWTEYEGPFNLPEECEHIIEFYAGNGTNSEPVNRQIHYVDNSPSPREEEYEFGEPNSILNYGGDIYTAIKKCTPMIIYAYDLPEGCASGVEWLNYSIWWNPNEPNNYQKIKEVKVHDNDANDTDKRVGFITVELCFNEECFHEIKWDIVDYLGHEHQQYSVDIAVDATPPTINKTIGEPKYIDERGWLWVNCSTPIWFNVTDDGCGGGVGVWMFGMNIYWNETRVPGGQQQLLTPVDQIVVVDNLAEITMTLYDESQNATIIVNTTTTELGKLLSNPVNTTWYYEGDEYNITNWTDNGNGTLDYCDYIRFYNMPQTWHVENITIVVKDLNPEYGKISYLFHFGDLPERYRECFHEPEIWAIDYVGNNYTFKEKDMVDCTPPAIRKDIEKITALQQIERNNSSDTSTTDYQSFKAPWSYIDAVSVYVNGTFNSAYPIWIEIYGDDEGEPGDLLAETEPLYRDGDYTGWLQFHLPERLYVEHGATYWIGLNYYGQPPIKWEAKSNYPNPGPYADGVAMVDGEIKNSWDFTFKIEYYAIYPYNYPYMYSLYNETLVDHLNNTWLTSQAILDLSSWDEGCMGGVGLKSLMYRIYFNETWHPIDLTDAYCGNSNITLIDGKYWYVAIGDEIEFTRIKFHEECTHYIEIRAEDLVGNVRIVNQTHYVDNSPPKLKVEYPDEHGFYFDEQTGKMFVRACKEFYLNLTDEPECWVGWRDFIFYFRYEYTNFTTPYIEKHPMNENDTQYGEVVNIGGELWWEITPQTPSITLHFEEECYHKIYYFYNASDWLDNSIVSDVLIEEIYVDKFEPEVSKEHPWCYKEEESIYLHPLVDVDDGGIVYEELYPEYGRGYYLIDGFEKYGNLYWIMHDEKYNVDRLYQVEPIAYTLYLYTTTNNEYIYLVYHGGEEPFEIGSLWHEVYPDYCNIYEIVGYNNDVILKNQTGEESEWSIEYDFSDYQTFTAYLYNETNEEYMYIEYVGGEDPFADGSLWHEVYPEFSTYYVVINYNVTHFILYNTKTGKESEWLVEEISEGDIKLKPVSYIRACDRINLTAKDMPDILKLVDQFQNLGDREDELQLRQSIPNWPWDAQTFQVSENISAINEVWLWLDWTGDANVTLYLHNDVPFLPGNELGSKTVHLTGSSTGEWVKFVFDEPVSVESGHTYIIDAFRENGSLVHWYHADVDVYSAGAPYISSEQSEGDWKFAIVAYRENPCASGIEGIYYAYEIGWDEQIRHPANETDAPHGEKIVDITQYYSEEEIDYYFNGYNLWYEYDESIGVHFYEECVHWLYYWAKDNVCHHTPVYMQVYEVDEFEPVVSKEHPEHGYYTPVEIDVDDTFENETDWLEGTFHVRDAWYWSYADGWIPNPEGQYRDKIQYINFTIYNNDMTHDLILRLHVEEIFGDSGITLENGSDVNYKVYTVNVPAGSSLVYTINVYDNLEFLRMGVWQWWAEVENVTQYLRAGVRINLSAYDPGDHPSGIENIYYRYEWNGNYYPVPGHPAARNGSEIQPDVPEIANYWWFIYDDSRGIVFNEECQHDLYYFAKDRACHNSTLHHQIYYVDASSPEVEEILPEHGAIGNTTTSLYESFEAPFGNGWAVVDGDGSTWSIKSEEPLFLWQDNIAHSGRYAAMAWTYSSPCAWLITPKITIPEDGNLTFWYKVYYGGSAGLKVGVNNITTQTDTSAFVEVWDSGIFSDTSYRHVEIDLSEYAGQEVYIGFHCYYLSNVFPYNGLLVDDVWVGSIHRIATLLDDDVENSIIWSIDDLTVKQTSYWQLVNRLPVASPPSPGWSENLPNKPAAWCGDLSLGNAQNGGGLYACNWDDTLTIKNPIDLSGATGTVSLSFNIWYYLQTDDNLYIEASNDSINWTVLETISGQSGWITKTIDMSQYIGNSTVWIRFRFVSDDSYNGQYNGVFIDNVTVKNETEFYFTPDFFNTLANWNAEMLETSKWHVTDYDSHSENHSWYCGVEPAYQYLNCMNDALISGDIDLTTGYAGKKAMLIFWHKYDMDNDYGDAAYVEVYADGTWQQLASYSGSRDWVQEFIDLSNYIGKIIKIRFRFYSNYYTTDEGWFVDDIKVEIREVEEAIFEDKFDMYKHTVDAVAVPRFPPTDGLTEYGDWRREGNYAGNCYYGWEQYVSPWFDGSIADAAVVHGYYYGEQEEYLYSPVIYDLPKFSNLTFRHYFESDYASAYVYLIDESGTWHLLKSFSSDVHDDIEDIPLWDYYGQDIQIVFYFHTPNGYGNHNTDYWAIFWVDITSHGFLRACAPITINASDLPENECAVGIDAIYWRYEVNGEEGEGYGDEYLCGCEIPGISEEDEEIYDYYWWAIYDNDEYDNDSRVGYISFEAHLPENCTHDLYYFAKDKLCHSSELKHERWYVDGTPPETWLGISWGEHPWIPKNNESGNKTYYTPQEVKPEVICINDDVHFYANHSGEACIYPYNWQNNTYYRWVWYNESSGLYEFYPTPDTPGAINGSSIVVSQHADLIQFNDDEDFWFGQNPPFGGYIYWMHYEEPFYFTEGCEHWLYYFSKDDLCNTEEPVVWHVGVDDKAPESKLDFEITNGNLYYNETSNVYYFQNCSWVVINTTDLPRNPDCQTGIWYIEYTVWRWMGESVDVYLATNQILPANTPVYMDGDLVGWIISGIDSNNNKVWDYGDYVTISWLTTSPYHPGETLFYLIKEISGTPGSYKVTLGDPYASGWKEPLKSWTRVYTSDIPSVGDGIKCDKWYDEEGREYIRIWIHLGELANSFACGKYEIHWIVYDYNNMTEGEKKQDVIIDCTPPRTKKEFEMPYVEETIAGDEVIHWVRPDTKIWLNASEDFAWDSGVNEIWYQFWNEQPILLWKLNDANHSKHYFTVEEAVKIILNDPDATVEDYFNARPSLNKTIIEIYHWAVDNVGHVEDKQKSKQHIYIDYMPPTSRVDEIIPYERDEIPFDIDVVDIVDHGSEVSGPVGVCKVEVYYSYSENNITWSDWMLYTTFNIPYEQRLDVPNQTFSFNAPEGGGWYRFISIAYDCLGNEEVPPYEHGTYDAECFVALDREPPVIAKEYGQPSIEIELDGETGHAITSNTMIYLNATDMPEENYVGLDKIYWSFDGTMWYETPSFSGARYGSVSFAPEDFGLSEGIVYHLFFKASDMRGQMSDEMKQKFIIDNSPPETSIVIGNNSTMPFDITINANDEIAGVKLIKLYFRYSSDGSTWTEWQEYGSYNGSSYTFSFIYKPSEFCYYKPGYYEFYAYAEDNLGNAKGEPVAEASCYVPPIKEDFNGDGRVNVIDLYYIISNWFKDTSSPDWETVQIYDLDNSGKIDAGDIYMLILKWTG